MDSCLCNTWKMQTSNKPECGQGLICKLCLRLKLKELRYFKVKFQVKTLRGCSSILRSYFSPSQTPTPLRQWSTWGIIFRGKMGYVRGTLRYGYIGHSRPESSFVGNFAFTIWSGQIYYCAPILLQWIPISHVTKSVTTRIRLDMVRLLVTTNFCVQQLDPIIWDSVQ